MKSDPTTFSPFQLAEKAGLIYGATTEAVVKTIAAGLQLKGDEAVCDIGSGTGEFILALAKLYPGTKLTGVEKVAEYLAESEKRRRVSGFDGSRVCFVGGDALETDYRAFDILYMYCPLTDEKGFYDRLSERLAEQMKSGARLACYGLDMSDENIRKLFNADSGVVAGYEARQKTLLEKHKNLFAYRSFTVPEEISPWPNLVEVYQKLDEGSRR